MMVEKMLGDQYELFMAENLREKRISDRYGRRYLSDTDISICDYLVDNLSYVDVKKINPGKCINRFDLIDICLKDIEKLGNDIYSEIQKNLFVIPIELIDTGDILQLSTGVSFELSGDKVKEDSGLVTKFLVPAKLHEIAAYFFGHEQLHAMKDINYNEYKDLKVLGEVIPIFYEFMIYSPEELIKKEVIKERIKYVFDNALEYSIFRNEIKENEFYGAVIERDEEYRRKKIVYEYLRTKVGSYLNSFYYALILYNLYKETPQKILDLVSKVLKHEITTMEMLTSLGIYGDIKGELFEKEFQNVKKLIRG